MSSNLKPGLVLGIIFLVGAVTGSALTIGLRSHFLPPPGEAQMKLHLMAHLTKRLNLTADQQAKIQPILADAATRIQAVQWDYLERGSQIFKSVNDQIAPYLTPEQKVELQKMESDREKKFSEHMRPWGDPRGGPGGMRHHGGPEGDMMSPPPPLPPPPIAQTNAAPAGPSPQNP